MRIEQQIHYQQNKPNFKGHTVDAKPVWDRYVHEYAGNPDRYVIPEGAVPNYPGAYPNKHTKIYIADPFEIVPDEVYKTHDYTVRQDLRLSDIQRQYKDGYKNFAHNAYLEKKFLTEILEEVKTDEEIYSDKVNRYRAIKELSDNKIADDKIDKILDEKEPILNGKVSRTKLVRDTLDNSNERFELLKEIDDTAGALGERNRILWEYSQLKQSVGEKADYISRTQKQHQVIKKEHLNNIKELKTLASMDCLETMNIDRSKIIADMNKKISDYKTYYSKTLKRVLENRKKLLRLEIVLNLF